MSPQKISKEKGLAMRQFPGLKKVDVTFKNDVFW